MNNDVPSLDGVPLSDWEISLVRTERQRMKHFEEKRIKQENCTHDFSTYLGHGHNDEAYGCVHCGKTKYV